MPLPVLRRVVPGCLLLTSRQDPPGPTARRLPCPTCPPPHAAPRTPAQVHAGAGVCAGGEVDWPVGRGDHRGHHEGKQGGRGGLGKLHGGMQAHASQARCRPAATAAAASCLPPSPHPTPFWVASPPAPPTPPTRRSWSGCSPTRWPPTAARPRSASTRWSRRRCRCTRPSPTASPAGGAPRAGGQGRGAAAGGAGKRCSGRSTAVCSHLPRIRQLPPPIALQPPAARTCQQALPQACPSPITHTPTPPHAPQAHAAHPHPQLLPGGRLHQAALPGLHGGGHLQRQALRAGHRRWVGPPLGATACRGIPQAVAPPSSKGALLRATPCDATCAVPAWPPSCRSPWLPTALFAPPPACAEDWNTSSVKPSQPAKEPAMA